MSYSPTVLCHDVFCHLNINRTYNFQVHFHHPYNSTECAKYNTAKALFVNTCTPEIGITIERWTHIFPNNCPNIGLTTFCLGLYLQLPWKGTS